MVKVELTVTQALSVYTALLAQQQRQRATLRDLLGRGLDPDGEDALTIAGALAYTGAALDAIDAAIYPKARTAVPA